MNNVMLLMKVLAFQTLSLNDIVNKESKNRKHIVVTVVGILLLIAFMAGYNVVVALTLANANQQHLIPSYMVATVSLIILVFTFLCSNSIIFGTKDYCMLCALPVSNRQIIGSKFLLMYTLSLLLSFLFLVPTGIIWLTSTPVTVVSETLYFWGVAMVPLVPMCMAILMGILVSFIASFFNNTHTISLMMSLLFLVGIFAIVLNSMKSGLDASSYGVMLSEQIRWLYPPSMFFLYGSKYSTVLNVLFYSISVVIYIFTITIAGRYYMKISALMTPSSNKVLKVINYKKQTQTRALYIKEAGRFSNSYIYMLNAGLGIFSLCLVSLAFCVVPLGTVEKYMGIVITSKLIGEFGPYFIASMLALSCTTASSISLEGINIQILRSIPLSKKALINAKILFNLTLHIVALFIAVIAFVIRFELALGQIILLIVLPISYSSFITVMGLFFNCLFPKFDWDNEVFVIKQSIPVVLSSVIALLSIGVPILLSENVKVPLETISWLLVPILLAMAMVLYIKTLHSSVL